MDCLHFQLLVWLSCPFGGQGRAEGRAGPRSARSRPGPSGPILGLESPRVSRPMGSPEKSPPEAGNGSATVFSGSCPSAARSCLASKFDADRLPGEVRRPRRALFTATSPVIRTLQRWRQLPPERQAAAPAKRRQLSPVRDMVSQNLGKLLGKAALQRQRPAHTHQLLAKRLPRVRIPPSPPLFYAKMASLGCGKAPSLRGRNRLLRGGRSG